jgi:hypothetical protein
VLEDDPQELYVGQSQGSAVNLVSIRMITNDLEQWRLCIASSAARPPSAATATLGNSDNLVRISDRHATEKTQVEAATYRQDR